MALFSAVPLIQQARIGSPSSISLLVAMAILFAVVARGTTILAKHAWCGGNFLEVTEQILAKIPSENNKLTYSHGRYVAASRQRAVYIHHQSTLLSLGGILTLDCKNPC